jgi:hypothetical protein
MGRHLRSGPGTATTRRSSGWPARVRWISGEALTTGASSKPDFLLQLLEVNTKDVDLSRRQLAQELGAGNAGELSGPPLGQETTLVPVDHRCESYLSLNLHRRLAQRGEYIVRERHLDYGHSNILPEPCAKPRGAENPQCLMTRSSAHPCFALLR